MTIKSESGAFVADGQWQLTVVDLSKCLRTYVADDHGKFVAKHLRIDFFNLNEPLADGKTIYYDFGYAGLCDDYTEILGTDTDVSEILFYDGSQTTKIPNTK